MRTEVATYRLQLSSEFTLDDAAAIAGYLSQLGISHLYSSPVLQAGKGSTHGYDVLDHSRVSKELGGEAAFERVSTALRTHDLGLLLDIVPNHMAIGGKDNVWWWDVLENGRSSRYAPYFDVEWMPPESKLHHMVMLPVLGDHYGRILDAGLIHIERHDGAFTIHYQEHAFPVAPRSLQFILARAASEAATEDLAFFTDTLEQLPSSWSTDWVSLRRRHRDKAFSRVCSPAFSRKILTQRRPWTAPSTASTGITCRCTNCWNGRTIGWRSGGLPDKTWGIDGFSTLTRSSACAPNMSRSLPISMNWYSGGWDQTQRLMVCGSIIRTGYWVPNSI